MLKLAILRKKSAPIGDEELRAEAKRALEAFWGSGSNGGAQAYAVLSDRLQALKFKPAVLLSLKRNLPVTAGGGTTAQKIETAGRCLEDLAEA